MTRKTDKEFLIRVKADINKAVKDLKTLSGEVGTTSKAAASGSKNIKGMGQSLTYLTRAAGAYVSIRMAWALIKQADAFNVLQARIKNATRETGDYNKVAKELYDISQDNGVALKNTVDVFQRLSQSRRDLGATNDQLLELTDLVQKLGVVSGSTGSQLDAGLLQFGQGLSAGVFRAEEFNSIVENLPALADSLAKGLGKSKGQLRAMVLAGKLLSKDVMEALLGQGIDINEQFTEMPDSIERATTSLENSFARFLSQLDKASNTTGTLVIAFKLIEKSLKQASDYLGEGELGRAMRDRANAAIRRQALLGAGYKKTGRVIQGVEKEIDDLDTKIIALNRKMLAEEGKQKPKKKEDLVISPAEIKRIDGIKKITAALDNEAKIVGKTKREVALYKLEVLKATPEQIKLAKASIATSEAVEEQTRLQRAARQVYESTRTEQEKMATAIERLNNLRDKGAITQDTYTRGIANLKKETKDFTEETVKGFDRLEAATKGWGDQFTNTLADMVQSGKLNFKDLADSIIKDLLRIMIYQQITEPLFTGMNIPGFRAGKHHTGGFAGAANASSVVNPALFVNAPRYHSGGFAGLRPDEVPAILQRGEEVIPKSDPRHAMNRGAGGNVKIEIINKGQPVAASDAEVSFDANGMVAKVVIDDIGRDGNISNAIGRAFNLRRGGG